MGSKSVLLYSVMFVFGTLMLLTATSNGLSNTFKVYAADNCDATSTCTNIPGTSTQRNNCNRTSPCFNGEFGASLNSQNNNCARSTCINNVFGGSLHNQNNNCANGSDCTNVLQPAEAAGSPKTQNTACQSSSCTNNGINTNVLSNSATLPCPSGNPDTTTLCQQGRSFTYPNH